MAKKLLITSSERLDKDDLTYGTSGYTDGAIAELNNTVILDKKSYSVGAGFRIEIQDQTSFPGAITVHGGKFITKAGSIVNSGDDLGSSVSVTLSGSNQTFYIELQAESTESDVDDRALLDNTFDNGAGNLPGKEYIASVPTRISTFWSVVTPVSTTAFSVTGDVNSSKFPLAILKTDSSGRITSLANTGMTTAPASTVLEYDAASASSVLRTNNALLFNPGDTVTVGFGTTSAETKTILDVDKLNSIITLTTGLSNPHTAGHIVRSNTATQYLVEGKDPVNSFVLQNGQADKQSRLFTGDATRGSALFASKYGVNSRDDSQIQNLKDYVDALALQIREMKVGQLGSSSTGTNFPVEFSQFRYFEFAGSVQGSKAATFTIGTGSNGSVGDFNGTNQVPFQTAYNRAIAGGFTDMVIYLKHGTYTFTSSVTFNINVTIVCESTFGTNVTLSGGSMTDPMFITSAAGFSVLGANIERPTVSTSGAISVISDTKITLNRVTTGTLLSPLVTQLGTVATICTLNVSDCSFSAAGAVTAIFTDLDTCYFGGKIESCTVNLTGTTTGLIHSTLLDDFSAENITYSCSGNGTAFRALGGMTNVHVYASTFNMTGSNTIAGVLQLTGSGQNISVSDCSVNYAGVADTCKAFSASVTSTLENFTLSNVGLSMPYNASATGASISGVSVDGGTARNITLDNVNVDLGLGKVGECIRLVNCRPQGVHINGCTLRGGSTGIIFSGLVNDLPTDIGRSVIKVTGNTYLGGNYDVGSTFALYHFGFRFLTLPNIIDLDVMNNNILGLRASTAICGIEVSGQNGSPPGNTRSKIIIQGNGIKRLGRPVADETPDCKGISCAGLHDMSTVRISSNQIDTIHGAQVYAIATLSGETQELTENMISNVACYTAGNGKTMGIGFLGISGSAVLSDNIITGLFSVSTSLSINGAIECTASNVSICGNQIAGFSGSFENISGAISISDSTGITCNDNSITGYATGVSVLSGSAGINRLVVANNNMGRVGSNNPLRTGITITRGGAGAITNVTINGNSIDSLQANGSRGLFLNDVDEVSVIGNTISEASSSPLGGNDASAVECDECNKLTFTGNTITGYLQTSAGTGSSTNRASIRLDTCSNVAITGNVLSWNRNIEPNNDADQANVRIRENSRNIAVVGNVITGGSATGSSTKAVGVSGASSDGIVVAGNVVTGDAAVTTLINLGTSTNVLYRADNVNNDINTNTGSVS